MMTAHPGGTETLRAALDQTLVPGLATAIILVAASMLCANECVTVFLERRAERSTGQASSWWDGAAAAPRALGHSPPGAVLVIGYYVGTATNVLPLPGGVGGVEAGMIGSFVGLRVGASLATVAVLAYRTISYWLPTLPGAVAYVRLRRTAGTSPADAE